MANTKVLPDIQGTEAISATWRRLLVRDRNVSNFFSGNSFTTDQTSEDIGRPNWRTDLNRLFIFDGTNFVSFWKYLTPDEIAYNIDHPDIPEGVENVRQVLDIIVNRNNLNTITMPAEGTTYIADGVTTDFELSRYTNNKFSVYIFIDGVKQNSETYELSEDGLSVKFKRAPANGESIEIMQLASLAEWDYSPIIKNFVGDGANKTFDMGVDVLNTSITSVNVNGREYQKSEFSLDASGRKIVLENAPEEGAKVQISIIGKTSFVTVSPNSIGTEELKDGSVTVEKLAGALPINVNNIEDGSLTTRMIANKAITSSKLNDSAVTTTKINNRAVTEDKLSDDVKGRLLSTGNVTTSNLSDGSVTKEKLSSAVIGEIEGKQEKLVAGENIKIEDNTISAVGGNKASWGKIEGNILDQTDLVTELDKKQDVIKDLSNIRSGASKGATALQEETDPIYSADKPNIALKSELPTLARANVPGLVAGGNWLTVNQNTGKMECGELTKTQYDNALGYTFISKTTLENVLTARIGNRTRKNITTLFQNGTLSTAIAAQNLEAYGITLGDYFTGASGYEYIIADYDTYYGGYNSYANINTHHVGLVVNTKVNVQWNTTYTTVGGYVASNLHKWLVETALPNIKTDLGTNHILSHQKLYSTAINASGYNRFGSNSGCSSSWAWSTDQMISALTESQVYGNNIWSSSGYDTGEAYKKLEVFSKFRPNQIFGYRAIWLRDIANSSRVAHLHSTGDANSDPASISIGGAALILFY